MPPLKELQLTDFRNVRQRTLRFSASGTVFYGPNGSGKSNLLESIHLLSMLRSFRSCSVRELVRLGADSFTISLDLEQNGYGETIRMRESLSGSRELFIGSSRLRKASDFIGEFRVVAFTPEDKFIASGSAGYRRRFFDMLISPLDPGYFHALANYNRALEQRNRALKDKNVPVAAAFEEELAVNAEIISGRRRDFSAELEKEVKLLLGEDSGFSIRYKGDAETSAADRLKEISSNRERELLRGQTLTGPQLDEFELIFHDRPLRGFGSTGQIRITTLMMKLASFQLVRRGCSCPVAVLADDVTGELDEANTELFLSTVEQADQRFFTFTEIPSHPRLRDLEMICANS